MRIFYEIEHQDEEGDLAHSSGCAGTHEKAFLLELFEEFFHEVAIKGNETAKLSFDVCRNKEHEEDK